MHEETDSQLLERARTGDRDSLERLLEHHQQRVYRFSLKMCRDSEDAKDVLQDTLLAAARGVREFRGASSLSTWLYTIARSFCIKKRRKSKFAPQEPRSLDSDAGATEVADSARLPDDALAGRQVERALDDAIAALAPMYREVLLLRDVEGQTASEVGQILGLSVQAVKSRLHRARLSVRERIAPVIGVPAVEAPVSDACPDIVSLFSQHLEGEISAETCARMERHIQACARCRNTCDSLERSLALCRTVASNVSVPVAVQASLKVALRNFLAENA